MASNDDLNGSDRILKRSKKAERLHKKLLYTTVAIDYLHKTVNNGIPEQRFQANVRIYFEDSHSRNAYELIDELEKKGLIGIGDYDILVEMTSFDVRIAKEIEDIKTVLHAQGIALYRRVDDDYRKELVEEYVYRCKCTILITLYIFSAKHYIYLLVPPFLTNNRHAIQ